MSIKVRLRKPLFEGTPSPQGATQNVQGNVSSNAAQPAAPAQPAQPATQQQNVPTPKPQVNTQGMDEADEPNLINICLTGLVNLLVREDAGGLYLKELINNKNVSQEVKTAAQKFAAVKPSDKDIDPIINGFVEFAKVCKADLQKQQSQQQQGQAQNNQQAEQQNNTQQAGQQNVQQNNAQQTGQQNAQQQQ